MPVLSIADIKAEIYTSTITDLELSSIVTRAYNEVLIRTGLLDDTNTRIQLAIKYTALVMTLRKMKTTDEMAASVETPGSKYQHTTDKDIEAYKTQAEAIIQPYEYIINSSYSSYSSPSCHLGFEHLHSYNCGGR